MSIKIKHNDFTASNGWLECWQKHYSIRLVVLCGQSTEVAQEMLTTGQHWSRAMVSSTSTTLDYYHAHPNRPMVIEENRRPRSITQSCWHVLPQTRRWRHWSSVKRPTRDACMVWTRRCFRSHIEQNRKTWMTSVLFSDWFEWPNAKMKSQKCHIPTFVCDTHVTPFSLNFKA